MKHRGGLGADLQLCALCGFFDGFVRVFRADGFWKVPTAYVNGDTFRQDVRGGQDFDVYFSNLVDMIDVCHNIK